jgi:hypothetical protein
MFKKTIKYTNFAGEEVEKDFYFHLSKNDLMRMAVDGSFQDRIKSIMSSKDNKRILEEFEDILRACAGVRSPDGERFIKDAAAQSELFDSPAYDELLFELLQNPVMATEFIGNLLPKKMQEDLKKEISKVADGNDLPDPFGADPLVEDLEDKRPAYQKENRNPTPKELQDMSPAELQEAFRLRINKQD